MPDGIARLVKEVGFRAVIDTIMVSSEPKSSEMSDEMAEALIRALAMVISLEAILHIKSHNGYDCATRMIEDLGEEVKKETHRTLRLALEKMGLPPMKPTTNEHTTAEILKEIEDDG